MATVVRPSVLMFLSKTSANFPNSDCGVFVTDFLLPMTARELERQSSAYEAPAIDPSSSE